MPIQKNVRETISSQIRDEVASTTIETSSNVEIEKTSFQEEDDDLDIPVFLRRAKKK